MKSFYKKAIMFFLVPAAFFSLLGQPAMAEDFGSKTGLDNTAEDLGYAADKTTGAKVAVAVTVGLIVKAVISLIGVLFMVLILMGSFELTSAAGNEERVKSGKNKIKNGAIGIIIVFGSYLVANAILAFVSDTVFKTGV